ncbi:hypothetical protein niasHT_003203 [Heterodera trifolii]|uniref:Cyclin-dependent kinase inhibitor domain-containing protein n=1 Tax=Heterodera trifolii TaxID=157864 RepID=A0ABD2LQD5_9BILA
MNSVLLPSADICSLVPHSTRPVWHGWGRLAEANGTKPKTITARRRLFQEDLPDEETNEQFVQRLLNELSERYKCKWGFDFETERPLENADSRFEFEAVPADSVPGFYRASNTPSPFNLSPSNSDTENHHSAFVGEAGEEEPMLIEGKEFGSEAGHCPRNKKRTEKGGAVLRKLQQKSIQTPKRRRSELGQTRVTDFLSTRKQSSVRAKKVDFCDDSNDVGSIADYSPHSRRRRSLFLFPEEMTTPKKSIVRQRRCEAVWPSSVVSTLFK